MNNRRIAMTMASIASLSLIASGCVSGAGDEGDFELADLSAAIAAVTDEQLEGTTISLARFFGDCEETTQGVTDLSQAGTECEAIQIITNKFNAENEWGIEVERLGGSEWNSFYDALNTSIAGGSPADIVNMHAHTLPTYASRGNIISFDAESVGIDLSDATSSAAAGVTWDGETYAVPFDLHAVLAHLNVDIFVESGLVDAEGNPVLPTSPEEFLEAAKKVKETTGKYFVSMAYVTDPMGFRLFSALVNQQGGELVAADGTVNIDSPEAAAALEFLNTLVDEGYADVTVDYSGSVSQFLDGNAALLVNGTWVVNEYDSTAPFTYQATDFPTLYDEPATWAASHVWALPRQSGDDPVRYRAALEFAQFLYDNTETWAIATGHVSPRTSVLESSVYAAAPQRANYVDTALSTGRLVPQVENWQAAEDAIFEQISSTWLSGKSVADALTEAQNRVEQALAR